MPLSGADFYRPSPTLVANEQASTTGGGGAVKSRRGRTSFRAPSSRTQSTQLAGAARLPVHHRRATVRGLQERREGSIGNECENEGSSGYVDENKRRKIFRYQIGRAGGREVGAGP